MRQITICIALPTCIECGQNKFKFDFELLIKALKHIRHNFRQKGFFEQNLSKKMQKGGQIFFSTI